MVWSGGSGDKSRQRQASHPAVKEMQGHYSGGVTNHLSKSTSSYGREMIATRLQQKNIAASTKNHQLPVRTSPSPNKNLLHQQQKNRRHTWFGGQSSKDNTLHARHREQQQQQQYNNSSSRPQTPNHKFSAGRSFADRMIRAVSPTKRSGQPYEEPSAFPMTTAALTTVKPVAVSTNIRSRHRSPHSMFSESRDDREYYGPESGGGSIVSNSPAPIYNLNDRIARIEQRLMFEEEHGGSHRSTLSKQKQQTLKPQRDHHHQNASPPMRYHYWDPPSSSSNSTPTPTLFAHTKKMVEQEKAQSGIHTWPSSEEDEKDYKNKSRRQQSSRDQRRRRHSTPSLVRQSHTENGGAKLKTASSQEYPRHIQRSKEKKQSKIHHATVQRQPSQDDYEQEDLNGTWIDVEAEEENSITSLPPTPKMSNFNTASSSSNTQEVKKGKEATDATRDSACDVSTKPEELLPEQAAGHANEEQNQLMKTENVQSADPQGALKSTIISRFKVPSIPCATPRNTVVEDEVNSILATNTTPTNQEATTSLIDNGINGVLSDLSSSTNGNAERMTMHSQTTQSGKGSLTIHNQPQVPALLFSKMSCAIPMESYSGPVAQMQKLCAGEETGDKTRGDDTLTTYPSLSKIPKEIPLVPGRSTPDVSLMDHPDHESLAEEDYSPSKENFQNDPKRHMNVLLPRQVMEASGQETTEREDRNQKIVSKGNPLPPQHSIPIVPDTSRDSDKVDAQEYWESIYIETNNTHDALQDLLQTPTNGRIQMEPEAAVAGGSSIVVSIEKSDQNPKVSPRRHNAIRSPKGGRRVLFSTLQNVEETNTEKRRPLVPTRTAADQGLVRPGMSFRKKAIGKPTKERKKNGMTLAASVDSITDQLKCDEKERQQRAEESRKAMEREYVQSKIEATQKRSMQLPPSALIREQKETRRLSRQRPSSFHSHTKANTIPIAPATKSDQASIHDLRQHEADDALVDILHLHNRSMPIGRAQKYKLSPYHPKSNALSKNHWGWFGRHRQDEKISLSGLNKASDERKEVRTLEAMPSSATSTITAGTNEGRKNRKELIDLSNEGSGSYHSIEQSRGGSAASSVTSYTTTSNVSETDSHEVHDSNKSEKIGRSSIPRATTYDEIIKDLKKFESQLPVAEFAVVEVGDDSDTQEVHTYLMNKCFVENELRSGAEMEEPLLVEMPFGLETIAELSLEDSYSMCLSSDVEDDCRAKDDSKMDKVKLSVSFAEQLRQLQSRNPTLRLEPTSPGKSYHI